MDLHLLQASVIFRQASTVSEGCSVDVAIDLKFSYLGNCINEFGFPSK